MLNYNYFLMNYEGTCSIDNLKPRCVTFIRKCEYIDKFKEVTFPIAVIAPDEFRKKFYDIIPDNVVFFFVENVDYEFTQVHNMFYTPNCTYDIDISPGCKIHETVILDVEGIKVVIGKNGKKIQFIHTGGVRIEEDVEIGAYSVVHRASMDMTIIKRGVKIGAHCNIGHNNIIGENTVIAVSVNLNGSVNIGKNCWLGTGCIIKNGISICDNVVIGAGSLVLKNIDKPGIYAGNPSRYLKSKPDDWNF